MGRKKKKVSIDELTEHTMPMDECANCHCTFKKKELNDDGLCKECQDIFKEIEEESIKDKDVEIYDDPWDSDDDDILDDDLIDDGDDKLIDDRD